MRQVENMTKKHHVRCWMRMLAELTSATVCVQHHIVLDIAAAPCSHAGHGFSIRLLRRQWAPATRLGDDTMQVYMTKDGRISMAGLNR